MKKLMILLLLATTTVTFAQSRSPLRFGLKAGGNISHLSATDDAFGLNQKNSFGLGIYGGGLLEISGPAGSKFKGQVEALFNWHNFKNESSITGIKNTYKTSLSQISVPVMLKYFVIPELSINAGASVNFNVAAKTNIETDVLGSVTKSTLDYNDLDKLQTIQVGALVGATYYIYKGFFVDARYNYYFGSMLKKDKSSDPSYRISALQIGVGYKF